MESESGIGPKVIVLGVVAPASRASDSGAGVYLAYAPFFHLRPLLHSRLDRSLDGNLARQTLANVYWGKAKRDGYLSRVYGFGRAGGSVSRGLGFGTGSVFVFGDFQKDVSSDHLSLDLSLGLGRGHGPGRGPIPCGLLREDLEVEYGPFWRGEIRAVVVVGGSSGGREDVCWKTCRFMSRVKQGTSCQCVAKASNPGLASFLL